MLAFMANRLPYAMAVLVIAIWCWGVQRHDDDLSPSGESVYGAVRQAMVIVTAPASLLALVIIDSLGWSDPFTTFAVAHVLWSLLAYVEWHLLVRAPGWLAQDEWLHRATGVLAFLLAVFAIAGIIAGRQEAIGSEHGVWWHTHRSVWMLGFAAVLAVLFIIPLSRRTR